MSDSSRAAVPVKTLALVGNPNVGKSVLFNRLTGEYAAVSNYPGTTVDVSRGRGVLDGVAWDVVDTPGVNSLLPFSEDERVTRRVLLSDRPDVVLLVLDAKNLRRGLRLFLELVDYDLPLAVVLNLMDEAMDRGIRIDVPALSRLLGVPVVPAVAVTGEGVTEVRHLPAQAAKPVVSATYLRGITDAIVMLESLWPTETAARRARATALLAEDDAILDDAPAPDRVAALDAAARVREGLPRSARQLIFEVRESVVRDIETRVFHRADASSSGWMSRLGGWCMRPWPGYLIAVLILYATYLFVGVFGAGTAVDFMENTIFGGWVVPWTVRLVDAVIPSVFIRDMLVGDYGVVSMALTYAFALILPIVATFFIAFGLLEDSGYLPRLSVLVDRFFRLMGLNGRAVLPMILGLGCDTMATVTTRILDTKKERIVVTLLLSLSIPCSAQLAVILGMAAAASPRVLIVWLLVLIGTTLAAGAAASALVPGARSPFLMEIPPLRRPLMRNILLKMKTRLIWYLKEVVPLFVYGTLGLFFLDRWGVLRFVERVGAPVVRGVLGLPAEATQAFLIGFLRRDYGAAGLYKLQQAGQLDLRQVTVSLVLITLFMPCIAQWLVTIKERGWRWAAVVTAVVLSTALLVAGALNLLLKTFPAILGG